MVGRRGITGPPRSYARGGPWPHAPVDGPPEVHAVCGFARRLDQAVAGRSLREVARAAGVDHVTVGAVLAGRRWPDVVTVARLEHALDADLWPGRGAADR